MPVTAKLSLLFYERLGEQVANELVEWFNAVDATYRADLSDLNERNFARFDAKLEQRLAELGSALRSEFRTALVQETELLRRELREQAGSLGRQVTDLETRMTRDIEQVRSSVIKWSFVFYLGTALTVIGLKVF